MKCSGQLKSHFISFILLTLFQELQCGAECPVGVAGSGFTLVPPGVPCTEKGQEFSVFMVARKPLLPGSGVPWGKADSSSTLLS